MALVVVMTVKNTFVNASAHAKIFIRRSTVGRPTRSAVGDSGALHITQLLSWLPTRYLLWFVCGEAFGYFSRGISMDNGQCVKRAAARWRTAG